MTKKSVTVVFEVNATSDYGEAPEFAVFEVDQSFIDCLKNLVNFMTENNLCEVREINSPVWHQEDEYRLEHHELILTEYAFWFRADVRMQDYAIETRIMDLAEIYRAFEDGNDKEVIFAGPDKGQLKELYEESLEA